MFLLSAYCKNEFQYFIGLYLDLTWKKYIVFLRVALQPLNIIYVEIQKSEEMHLFPFPTSLQKYFVSSLGV